MSIVDEVERRMLHERNVNSIKSIQMLNCEWILYYCVFLDGYKLRS